MKLRGAISGFGQVAEQGHLAGWRERPDVSIVAIHDPIAERRHQALRLIKNVRVYDDLALMLDGEALDFVDIASPPAFHADAVRTALEAGAHVLVEKPLCLDLSALDSLVELAKRKSRILMCVHNWQFAPAYARAKELIEEDKLGAINYIAMERMRTEPAGAGLSERWRQEASTGGGILIDHGWHVFYLMRWMMGGASPKSISARLETPPNGNIEDLADIRLTFPEGRIAYAHLSWRSPVRRTTARIYGDKAILEIEGNRLILTARDGRSYDLSVEDIADDSYHSAWFAGMAEHFERAIADGFDSVAARENIAEARTALALVLGARESARLEGAEVALTD